MEQECHKDTLKARYYEDLVLLPLVLFYPGVFLPPDLVWVFLTVYVTMIIAAVDVILG